MTHGAAHDAAKHVAAALVERRDAVGDEEGRGAQMVGDDAVAGGLRAVRIDAGFLRDRADERAHQVGLIGRGHALQQGRDALEAHAGVDRGARQRHALAEALPARIA